MIINHIGCSSGKDSTALWGWAINESGYDPASIRGSFCDTGNEYQEVYDQIKALDEYGQKRGIAPIRTLRNTDMWTWNQHPLFLALAIHKKRFPSPSVRFCTKLLKIIPTLRYFQELQLEGHEIVAHSGVRADESTERSIMEEFGHSDGVAIRRPMLTWTIRDVWDAHKRYGLTVNPLYRLIPGRARVGCKLCMMSDKRDVKSTAKHRPESIDTYRQWEPIVGQASGRAEISSFFSPSKTPKRFHSIHGLISKKGKKKGQSYSVPTIDDVVRWSFTLHGGKPDNTPDLFANMFEEDDSHAPCLSGYCE